MLLDLTGLTPVPGTVADANQVTNALNAIKAVVNSLDGANINPAATPTVSALTVTVNLKTAISLSGAGAGITIGGDANLYRGGAAQVKTDGALLATTGFIFVPPAASGSALASYMVGEAQPRFYIDYAGVYRWGPGGSTGPDTQMYRSSAGLLVTDTDFQARQFRGTLGADLTVTANAITVTNTIHRIVTNVGPQVLSTITGNANDGTLLILINKTGSALSTNTAGNIGVATSLMTGNGAAMFFYSAADAKWWPHI